MELAAHAQYVLSDSRYAPITSTDYMSGKIRDLAATTDHEGNATGMEALAYIGHYAHGTGMGVADNIKLQALRTSEILDESDVLSDFNQRIVKEHTTYIPPVAEDIQFIRQDYPKRSEHRKIYKKLDAMTDERYWKKALILLLSYAKHAHTEPEQLEAQREIVGTVESDPADWSLINKHIIGHHDEYTGFSLSGPERKVVKDVSDYTPAANGYIQYRAYPQRHIVLDHNAPNITISRLDHRNRLSNTTSI